MLSVDSLLARVDWGIGMISDFAESGIEFVLSHHFANECERPIANVLKTLVSTQKK